MAAQKAIVEKYGVPDIKYQYKYCTVWEIAKDFPWITKVINSITGKPLTRIFINIDFKNKLFIALKGIEAAGLQNELVSFDGCYESREVRGANTTSLHAWAMATDWNAKKEKLGQKKTSFSPKFIKIMKDAGLFWGGDFKNRKDPMHFAFYNG